MANVTGPASSTNNALALWDGTSGTVIKDSSATFDSMGNLTCATVTLAGGNCWTDLSGDITGQVISAEVQLICARIDCDSEAFMSDGSGNIQANSYYGTLVGVTADGTADAITASYVSDFASLDPIPVDGMVCIVVPNGTNTTTTPTFSLNGSTARTITKHGGSALSAGDIVNLGPIFLEYNDANTRWELLNPVTGGTITLTGDITGSGAGSFATTIKTNVALAGSPTTTTQSQGDNSTKIATTAYVDAAVASGGGKAPTFQYLSSGSGATYTTPANCTALMVEIWGGGGGGGGGGGSGTDNAGGDGGDSIFNSVHAAAGKGGAQGTNSTGGNGGKGTTAGTGTAAFRVIGSAGHAGSNQVGPGNGGGIPGSSALGGAGSSVRGAAGTAAANNSGSGGAGGAAGTNGGGGGGQAGEYAILSITSPASTYGFTIGAAGSAGSGTLPGGAGGTGFIRVTEYY